MLSASFIFEINLAENVKQLGFEFESRISTTKSFATCTRDNWSSQENRFNVYAWLCMIFVVCKVMEDVYWKKVWSNTHRSNLVSWDEDLEELTVVWNKIRLDSKLGTFDQIHAPYECDTKIHVLSCIMLYYCIVVF